jgi:hypothetical protein
MRDALRASVPPVERPHYDQIVDNLLAELGEDAFASSWAEGRAMTLEQAVAYALDEQPSA